MLDVDMYQTSVVENVTTSAPPGPETDPTRGFIVAAIAVVFFGSNFVPVKTFQTGDGLFFQWILCCAIWVSGLVVHCVQGFPTFYPLAMLGGFLWATGNITVVPIIHCIGLGQGVLIWASVNLVTGWLSGRFGWFGLKPEIPSNTTLNYIGMACCFSSAFIVILIKSSTEATSADSSPETAGASTETSPLLADTDSTQPHTQNAGINTSTDSSEEGFFINRWSPLKKRLVGTVLAVLAGILYGVNFAPVIYIQDNYKYEGSPVSQNGLDYVFTHFCGIFLTSTTYFLLYCMLMRNRPRIYPRVILPSFVSGIMWAIADICWFIANSDLSEAVSFPIINSGPGILAALWGVLFFKEIRGWRNLSLLLVAFCFVLSGSLMCGFSN